MCTLFQAVIVQRTSNNQVLDSPRYVAEAVLVKIALVTSVHPDDAVLILPHDFFRLGIVLIVPLL